jgi:hypothetical protein
MKSKRRIISGMLLMVAIVLLLITSCGKNKAAITGIWQLRQMEVHGTSINGNSLGDWLWEFNKEGQYLTDIAGAKEKGSFKLTGKQLTMQPVSSANRPTVIYNVVQLDTASMDLVSADSVAGITLHFYKRNAEDVTGDKD